MNNEHTPQDDGLELLRKVIESNQENILTNQSALIAIANFEKLAALEEERRKSYAESISHNLEIRMADEHLEVVKSWDKNMLKSKNLHFLLLGSVAVSLLVASVSGYFATKWYAESIKAKSELRQEILDEIKNDDKAIYNVKDYNQLERNTDIMNKWMRKNPKDAEKFFEV